MDIIVPLSVPTDAHFGAFPQWRRLECDGFSSRWAPVVC